MTETNGAGKKRVAILIEQKVEDAEFQVPYNALKKAGADVVVLGSRMNEEYKGKQNQLSIKPDATTTEVTASEFDFVIIPGGMAPDQMRTNMKTVRFVKDAVQQGIGVAAICHGPQVLIEGDLLKDKQATGFRSIRKDIQNAGAEYVDAPLVVDGNLITSRRPGDLPIFTTAILKRLGLSVPDTTLPDEDDVDAGWWKLGEEWGGSSKSEIVGAINTAIAGERYGLESFQNYLESVTDGEICQTFKSICAHKQQHIQQLEARLSVLGEQPSLKVTISSVLADLKGWLQSNKSDATILRRALGDLQTGVVDTYNLRNKITDPATVAIFDDMEVVLAKDEQQIGDLYHNRIVAERSQPPMPTSRPAVSS
ncbi:DJ-1/PfpI/YhbO family deglycase/protease [Leptolyngbya sp. FACHB-36]|uniref:DJ-1/PfpI/YhbO family deglycase/protease n=1 Tax=Leptolyngbya sp. FACHB-36 TaxID=2692808 RepID=UPI0016800BCE|nr:DJ-1/PfpI/YhbO family deglycase/protease [Leptolyngbya sp. FACHB-36]MBD2021763.1 DJ-1/PfpI/YhbO family deglycase/protease [Leptolyngbya sp. FACHB-36]